ncbi:hypothetical protein CCACVL1_24022 [Corchorus capsularis]|uniref:Uncharacterized protein n=1 Tax=Corchorus capsularis TaxID=210143 RepID=A0A1R3GRC7_COCAP|nr:hypothetical protein CCACVL1_24022 [Corchorus capsularis]
MLCFNFGVSLPLIHEVLNKNEPDIEGLWSLAFVAAYFWSADLLITPLRELPVTLVFLHYLGIACVKHGKYKALSTYASLVFGISYFILNDVNVYGWIEKQVETEDENVNVNGRDAEVGNGAAIG